MRAASEISAGPVSRAQRITAALLLAAAALALVFAARTPRDQRIVFEDERHYLRAAVNLALHGRLAFGDPALPAADGSAGAAGETLLREPGYPAALALVWRVAGAPVPDSNAAIDALFDDPKWARAYGAIRALHLLLLALAAAAVGWAVHELEGSIPGAAAAFLVAASPALSTNGTLVLSENLTAPLLALFAAGSVGVVIGRERIGFALLTPTAALLPLVRAETIFLLPLAALVVAASQIAGGPAPRLGRRAAAFVFALALLALPTLGWMARNQSRHGHFAISDRGGLALAVRAALDADVRRFGAQAAALSFTPAEWARDRAHALEPEATFLDNRPEKSENFLLRTYRRFEDERARPGADALEVDRRLGREALANFAAHPVTHIATAAVVAWRALFAERSPQWAHPFDLTLAIGVVLGAAGALHFLRALAARDGARLAFLAPAAVIVLFHSAATEFLPRYTLPLLPLAWGALVMMIAALRYERRRAEHVDAAQPDDLTKPSEVDGNGA